MLRNSKPIISNLNQEQFEALLKIGFCKYQDSIDRPIDNVNTKAFYKPYDCCGGTFKLEINLSHYWFNNNEVIPSVKIHTPYDRWWSDNWNLSDFTKEMEKFLIDLENDIKELRKLGVIS